MLEPRRPISEIASLLASLTPDRPSFNATLFASVEKPKRAVASFVRDNDGLIDAMERMIGTWPTVAHGGPRWPTVAHGGPRWPTVAGTDGDGFLDGQEYPPLGLVISNPLSAPAIPQRLFANGFEASLSERCVCS